MSAGDLNLLAIGPYCLLASNECIMVIYIYILVLNTRSKMLNTIIAKKIKIFHSIKFNIFNSNHRWCLVDIFDKNEIYIPDKWHVCFAHNHGNREGTRAMCLRAMPGYACVWLTSITTLRSGKAWIQTETTQLLCQTRPTRTTMWCPSWPLTLTGHPPTIWYVIWDAQHLVLDWHE